ncbi:MAG: glycosyltransferase family 2 protein [Candidatus Zixiibacteriota bacterium]
MKSAFIMFYFSLLGFVVLYGVNTYWLITIYLKHRKKPDEAPDGPLARSQFPQVTIQLPVYDEMRVAVRLIEAARQLDWPAEQLEIQVLDDSTDITSDLIRGHIESVSDPRIAYLHRSDRQGYKAGALAAGLKVASGEFIAVFDADNLPHPDFLRRALLPFNDESVGLVQTRWGFLNRDESLLCRAQALFLDAHFLIEQFARYRGGMLFNFNGTAGIWRRRAIADAGGWQFDTLTEDLDLSLRAQLAGWRFAYLNRYTVPTELPNSIAAFKSQQYRWAKGAVQTGLKLLPTILRHHLPLRAKVGAVFHVYSKALSLALLLLAVLLIPALYIRLESGMQKLLLIDFPIFIVGTGSVTLFYSLAHRAGGGKRSLKQMLTLPMLTSLGIALAVNNCRALLSALLGRHSSFVRTPKSGSTDSKYLSLPRAYNIGGDITLWIEIFLACYSFVALVLAFEQGLYFTVPFMATFFIGYYYFSYRGLRDAFIR